MAEMAHQLGWLIGTAIAMLIKYVALPGALLLVLWCIVVRLCKVDRQYDPLTWLRQYLAGRASSFERRGGTDAHVKGIRQGERQSDDQPNRGHGCLYYVGLIVMGCMVLSALANLPGVDEQTESVPTPDPVEVKRLARPITYDDLARDTEQHVGQPVSLEGEIIQVVEHSPTDYDLRIDVTRGDYGWSDTVFVRWQGERFLENDVVRFWGLVWGRYTYRSILGANVSLPEVRAADMELVE